MLNVQCYTNSPIYFVAVNNRQKYQVMGVSFFPSMPTLKKSSIHTDDLTFKEIYYSVLNTVKRPGTLPPVKYFWLGFG